MAAKYEDFENYSYPEQANVIKTRANWLVGAVRHHVRRGKLERKNNVSDYPTKVIDQLNGVIDKLKRVK